MFPEWCIFIVFISFVFCLCLFCAITVWSLQWPSLSTGTINIPFHLCLQIMCRCSTTLENSVKEKISMFCHVEPEQVHHWRHICRLVFWRSSAPTLSHSKLMTCLVSGHLCARCVIHLQSASTAGGSGSGGLPESAVEYAHRYPTQKNAG